MQQPGQMGYLHSSLLRAQTPSSGLTELNRDWGTLRVWSPEPHRAHRTKLLLHGPSSTHGATGMGRARLCCSLCRHQTVAVIPSLVSKPFTSLLQEDAATKGQTPQSPSPLAWCCKDPALSIMELF